ncbi:kinase-like protein [Aureobasidium melanogenum CBS 110374]|uniref:Kinase-like protein n=1 Tax=Aureobasidium melanogenum (strain CBS 110374) TaxID=1043003 RepID=A0A074VRW7_AURM1|nr:kinase-like protein [Aureobasidium melanogenum CBS 110374]KEQ61974.1 kinase-like protein [Aureobasidium melanogenum CBS 110374]
MTTAARPYYRHASPLSVFNPAQGFAADAPMMQRIDVGDSSDDEIPPPMKFSALTRALLDAARDYETPSRAPQLKITRHASAESSAHPGSVRVKRAPGAFLRGAPVRRGFRRRESDDNHDAAEDQENIPPPTFKRDRHHDFKYLGKPEKIALHSKSQPVEETPMSGVSHQSPRRALTSISNNTPVRPAPPPPPKMSVLDAATKTAGASTTKSKKRRQHILINGKLFTQMNKVGKGGSSDVYCVMAENYKLFALKKVKLEDCDESAMRGFKGEIDLLEKLADVDRVIRLFDWELDNEKQILSVLMEKGDQDLNRILTIALNGSDPKFDPVLTRFYWKEMLECVQAVHDYDIVHSDLKPANFLSVQGKLKLIDFGIANAIDIAHTVNVHRDSHIGTPNYMSPESILDTNAPTPGSERTSNNGSRLMKIGKPSDVWSLGCILYQMVYGRPPFAHIANQISRIMAITNSKVVIEFPDKGVGGVTVPSALKGTLRRCLQRDLHARPTVKQLLSHSDPWLYPDVGNAVAMSEDLLAQIIDKVVERCKDPKRGIPSPDEVKQYPASFMSKIREMVERDGVVG